MTRKKHLETLPIIIVDIGALGGVHKKWEQTKYDAVLFEPNPKAKFQKKENWLVLNSALSDCVENRELYITMKDSKSSFYMPNFDLINKFSKPGRFDVVEKIILKTDTLDNQLNINEILDVDYIKLDVQGHELAILKGGTESLNKAVAVEIEVEFSPIYKNQPLFADVDTFLKQRGFELVGFINLETWEYGERQCLIWGDAFYVKNLESLDLNKRRKLNIIKTIINKKTSTMDTYMESKNIILKRVKLFIKKLLFSAGLGHPSLGIKISAKEKVSTLLQYKTKDINIFVETGTSEGDTIADLANYFQKIYSIELDHNLYTKAVERFRSNTNIKLLEGDSSVEIKKVLLELKEPALFWLDAHASGTITTSNSPIIGELESIFALMVKGGVILIDDARHFDRKTIRKIKKIVKVHNYNFVIENGIFRLNEK